MQESSDNPGDAGGGLAQWQGDRYTALEHYANSKGLSPTSGQAALGYLAQDLGGAYKGLRGQLNGARSPGEAATLFSQQYERPGIPMIQNRINYANQAFKSSGGALGLPTGGRAGIKGGGGTKTISTPGFNLAATVNKTDTAALNQANKAYQLGTYLKSVGEGSGDALGGLDSPAGSKGVGISTGPSTLFSSGLATTTKPDPADYTTAQSVLQHIAGSKVTLAQHPGGNDLAVAGQAVKDAKNAGASKDAQKLLRMIHATIGGAYNQGNRDLNENEFQIRRSGTDCSGFVSWLMGPQGLGIWHQTLATPGIPSAPGLQKGQGNQVTIWNNAQAGNAGHVFIQVGNQYFASEGGAGIRQLPLSEVRMYQTQGSDGGHYQAFHPRGL